jgi:hypothetical protein
MAAALAEDYRVSESTVTRVLRILAEGLVPHRAAVGDVPGLGNALPALCPAGHATGS